MLIGVVDILSGIVVLDYLVFYDTHSGFFHCHFCQRQTCVVCSQRSCPEDLVYLFLRECRKLCLCLTHFLQLAFQRRNAIHQRSVVLCFIQILLFWETPKQSGVIRVEEVPDLLFSKSVRDLWENTAKRHQNPFPVPADAPTGTKRALTYFRSD